MTLLQEASVRGDGRVFRCDFASIRRVQDIGGVITGCVIGTDQYGSIVRVNTSDKVVFAGTEAISNNQQRMTIAMRFRSPSSLLGTRNLICKTDNAVSNCQWLLRAMDAWLSLHVGDINKFFYTTNNISASTEYLAHGVYDGTLAAGSRGIWYLNGAAPGTGINGTLDIRMLSKVIPVSVFNAYDAGASAPNTDFIMRSVRIYDKAWSAQECLDDYLQQTFQKITGGGA